MALASIIVPLITFGISQSRATAERERENTSRVLASFAESTADDDPGRAALAAVAAYRVAPTQEAVNALLQRYEKLSDAVWMLSGFQGTLSDIAMSVDGSVVFGVSSAGRGTLFHRLARGRLLRRQLSLPGRLLFPLVSRDGRRIAYLVSGRRSLYWHDVRYTEHDIVLGPAQRLPSESPVMQLSSIIVAPFSPSARRIAAVETDGRVRVWDLESRRLQSVPERLPKLKRVWFGPDEHTVVGTLQQKESVLVRADLRNGAVRILERGEHAVGTPEIEVSADGSVATVCQVVGAERRVIYRVLRVADGQELNRYVSPDSNGSCHLIAASPTGDRVAVQKGGGEWTIIGGRASTSPRRFKGPEILRNHAGPLLGTSEEPIVVQLNDASVIGWRLHDVAGPVAFSRPVLFEGGDFVVFRAGTATSETADRLVVMEVEGEGRTLGLARIPPVPSDADHLLAVNRSGTLVADVSGANKITVYRLPDLHQVAAFTIRPPPRDDLMWKPLPITFFFISDDEMVTASGTVVEHWNVRDGRRLSAPFDLRHVFKDGSALEDFHVRPHYKLGHVQVAHYADRSLRVVRLATGTEDSTLRIRAGDNMLTAVPEASGRYAMVLTSGTMVELWSVAERTHPRKIFSGLGPLQSTDFQVDVLPEDDDGNPRFFLASGRFVRFLRVTGSGEVDVTTYSFAARQSFVSMTDQGMTLLRVKDGSLDVFRLDPELWASHMCAVIGRDIDVEERRGLPRDLPATVCPAA